MQLVCEDRLHTSQVRVLHVAHLIVSAINLQFLIIFGSEGVYCPSSL